MLWTIQGDKFEYLDHVGSPNTDNSELCISKNDRQLHQ